MFRGPSQAIARPHEHGIKSPTVGILHKLIECGSPDLGPAYPVVELFLNDVVSPKHRELTQFVGLRFRMLVDGRYPRVQRSTLHIGSAPPHTSTLATRREIGEVLICTRQRATGVVTEADSVVIGAIEASSEGGFKVDQLL